jgi:hypothetical protein
MFVVSALVQSEDVAEFRVELADWLDDAVAVAHRMYSEEDGTISIFVDYPSEHEARCAAATLKETWPFRSASPADDGRYTFVLRAASGSPRVPVAQR